MEKCVTRSREGKKIRLFSSKKKMFWIFCRFPFHFSFTLYFSGPDFSWENDSFRYSNWIQIFSLLLVVCLSYFPDKSQHHCADTLSCENEEFFSNISISFFHFSLFTQLNQHQSREFGREVLNLSSTRRGFCHFKFLIDSISLPRHYCECLLENKNTTNWTQQSYTTFNFFQA